MADKVGTHFFGDGQGQMQMGHIQQLLRNTPNPFVGTHFSTGRTKTGLAGEGDEPVVAAAATTNAGEALAENAAAQIALEVLDDIAG